MARAAQKMPAQAAEGGGGEGGFPPGPPALQLLPFSVSPTWGRTAVFTLACQGTLWLLPLRWGGL